MEQPAISHRPEIAPEPSADAASGHLRPGSTRRRRGATAMEYLFVISLILVVAITGIGSFGQHAKNLTQKSATSIENATKSGSGSGGK